MWLNKHRVDEPLLQRGLLGLDNETINLEDRDWYTLARSIHEGKLDSHATTWGSDPNARAVCPCALTRLLADDTSTRTAICSDPSNPVGLHGTHDRAAWTAQLRLEADNPSTATPTYEKYYCLCGSHYTSPEERNAHSQAARNNDTHGPFFDELATSGGANIAVNISTLQVVFA